MILLTGESIQIDTDTYASLGIHSSYEDWDGAVRTFGRQNIKILGPSTTEIVSAPSEGNQRTVKSLSIRNSDNFYISSIAIRIGIFILFGTVLAVGEHLYMDANSNWTIITSGLNVRL